MVDVEPNERGFPPAELDIDGTPHALHWYGPDDADWHYCAVPSPSGGQRRGGTGPGSADVGRHRTP